MTTEQRCVKCGKRTFPQVGTKRDAGWYCFDCAQEPVAPLSADPSDDDLHQFGYAPGSYVAKCMHCDQEMWHVDKRAICCRPCAVEIFKNPPTPAVEALTSKPMSQGPVTGPPFTMDRYESFGACVIAEREWLRAEIERLTAELDQQCLLHGKGAQREAKLLAEVERLRQENAMLRGIVQAARRDFAQEPPK